MPDTPEFNTPEQLAWEMQCYGCPAADLEKGRLESITVKVLGDHDGTLMLAMSYLSDAQEMLSRGNTEEARQWINVAKKYISTQMRNAEPALRTA